MKSPAGPADRNASWKCVGRLLVEVEELLAQRALLLARARALLVLDGDAVALAERLDGLGEGELLGFADERDRVARLAAAEALVEALVHIDVEGGRLLAVERAEALQPRAARLAQGDDARDHVGDVHAKLQVADAGGFDDGHGRAAGPAVCGPPAE